MLARAKIVHRCCHLVNHKWVFFVSQKQSHVLAGGSHFKPLFPLRNQGLHLTQTQKVYLPNVSESVEHFKQGARM